MIGGGRGRKSEIRALLKKEGFWKASVHVGGDKDVVEWALGGFGQRKANLHTSGAVVC